MHADAVHGSCMHLHACTMGVSWQLIVTECSEAVTKITVHYKACALSREALWYKYALKPSGANLKKPSSDKSYEPLTTLLTCSFHLAM